MSHFMKRGNKFVVAPNEALDIRKELPAGTYVVDASPEIGYFLEQGESFRSNSKIYGDTKKHSARILSTYMGRPQSTGVLLVGEKRSGKTLLTKIISQEAETKHNIPTLIVNQPFRGSGFNQLLQQIHQPCIVLFDEFEKVYDSDQQKEILTLFDGVFPTKKLFLLTVNDHWKIDSHMKNRPGRLFYMLEFEGLTESFIFDYCVDNLSNKSHIPTLCKYAELFEKFNFDMLKAIVEEMNRYNETPKEVFLWLNIRPDMKKQYFTITATHKDKLVGNSAGRWTGNPLTDNIHVKVFIENEEKPKPTKKRSDKIPNIFADTSSSSDDERYNYFLTPQDISKMDGKEGVFEYDRPKDKVKVILTKDPSSKFNFKDYNV